jgi:hypothetical protein
MALRSHPKVEAFPAISFWTQVSGLKTAGFTTGLRRLTLLLACLSVVASLLRLTLLQRKTPATKPGLLFSLTASAVSPQDTRYWYFRQKRVGVP